MRTQSQSIYEESCRLIPGGVNSPVRAFGEMGISPLIVHSGSGDQIVDADGHTYIDYCGSWGALILGHAHPKIVDGAIEQLKRGSSFGISTEIERTLAKLIIKHMPAIEKIRFVSSGTEAGMSAIRLARGFTKRSKIIKFNGNYHGHSDSLLVQAGSGVIALNPESSSKGVPPEVVKHTISLPYNATEIVRKTIRETDDIAAVLIEPVSGNMGVIPGARAFLQMLREETEKKGILLIFDEVISGFRVGLGGAQALHGIRPDLTCLGKIIGGGFPAAAFGGRREIMDHLAPLGEVYQAGTLSGNPVAMRAGYEALQEIERPGFYEELEAKTVMLTQPIVDKIKEKKLNACLHRVGSMFTLFFGVKNPQCKEDLQHLDQDKFRNYFLHLFGKGIYIPPSAYEASFVSMSHTPNHLTYTRDTILNFLDAEE
jgi:glutamate-1-semialdehyde 2,1-aminomutase